MRGLKRQKTIAQQRHGGVASFTDAWIETDNAIKMSGLEVVASFTDAWIETKAGSATSISFPYVASFTDAWIETKERNMIKLRKEVASFTDAWIETEQKM